MAAVSPFRSSLLASRGRRAPGAPPAASTPRRRQGRPSVGGGAGAAAASAVGRCPLRVCAVAQPLGPTAAPHAVEGLHAEEQPSLQELLRGYYQVRPGPWLTLGTPTRDATPVQVQTLQHRTHASACRAPSVPA